MESPVTRSPKHCISTSRSGGAAAWTSGARSERAPVCGRRSYSSRQAHRALTRWRCCRPATPVARGGGNARAVMLIGGEPLERAAFILVELLRVSKRETFRAAAAEWSAHQTPAHRRRDGLGCLAESSCVEGLTGRRRPSPALAKQCRDPVDEDAQLRAEVAIPVETCMGVAPAAMRRGPALSSPARLLHHEGRHLRDARSGARRGEMRGAFI